MVSQINLRISCFTSRSSGCKHHGNSSLGNVSPRLPSNAHKLAQQVSQETSGLSTTSRRSPGCKNQGNPTPGDFVRSAPNKVHPFQVNRIPKVLLMCAVAILLMALTPASAAASSNEKGKWNTKYETFDAGYYPWEDKSIRELKNDKNFETVLLKYIERPVHKEELITKMLRDWKPKDDRKNHRETLRAKGNGALVALARFWITTHPEVIADFETLRRRCSRTRARRRHRRRARHDRTGHTIESDGNEDLYLAWAAALRGANKHRPLTFENVLSNETLSGEPQDDRNRDLETVFQRMRTNASDMDIKSFLEAHDADSASNQ